jgi:4-carboxymuconolactone decarboxylase
MTATSAGATGAVPRVARQEVHDANPVLGWYTDAVLYHDVWNRPGLDRRDRSLVTVAALIVSGQPAQLRGHTGRALNHGLTPGELRAVLTHCAFYGGWPRAMSALPVMTEVLAEGPVAGASLPVVTPVAGDEPHDSYLDVVSDYLEVVVAGGLWSGPELSERDRTLVTVAAILAGGHLTELVPAVESGLAAGVGLQEFAEVLGHLAFYVGFPAATAAGRLLDDRIPGP